jgi:glycosyltransferase involved in cell wall biosynthesis
VNIWLENANLSSNSGPNSFARKLVKEFQKKGIKINVPPPEVCLCFIESHRRDISEIPTVQRLDGIYFNTRVDWRRMNENIYRTYKAADGVIFQSNFARKEITKFFGEPKSFEVIHNGADLDAIDRVPALSNPALDQYENIWSCAASWRPHKRLRDNINYFLEHSGDDDVLFIAGDKQGEETPENDKIKYLGTLDPQQLISLYKASTYFIHLAWLDHCPNVVVDARACGCKVICTSSGGSPEIAGPDAIIIEQEPWNLEPVDLYDPPPLDFSKKINNTQNVEYNMSIVADKYRAFLESAAGVTNE